jgi:hypothetical protein
LIKVVERKIICSKEEICSQEKICSEEICDEEVICNQVSKIFQITRTRNNQSEAIVSSAQRNRSLFFERFLLSFFAKDEFSSTENQHF